ncbi:unnamed protein product [Ostreobium quekettii]|uniref:cysteine desulfurase n=1 Tax=Ostreobium quekettii TaxID=121088 RepID=A0A8S1J0I1_9CHLO|nr:unnamed protein product [Ostreobium quekettii]|eukprot:evm.model.scf_1576.4 EVM.evm.TU.scf_1576.4   scf_1576:25191-29348(+)
MGSSGLPRSGLELAARAALASRSAGRLRLRAQAVDAPAAAELGTGIRSDFPVLDQRVNGRPLVYFDNAATSQKPLAVLEAMEGYYRTTNSNVHRGVHALSARATAMYEAARDRVAAFVGAGESREVVFTRNASEAMNLVAYSWGMSNLREGDEIIISTAEHHSNIVPWQIVAKKTGARLRAVTLTKDTEELDMQHFRELLSDHTKLVSLFHVSNTLGAVSPVEDIAEMAHKVGARVLLDCCQSVPNRPVDVQDLGADWIVASGHKMCGPTGCGFLWGRYDVLEEMTPFMGGGEMIEDVFISHSTYAPPPARFEAGTPAIAEAIGLGAACDYLSGLGMHRVHAYEQDLGAYLYDRLKSVGKVRIYGPPPSVPRSRASLCAFNVEGLHASDVAALLDQQGVAVRSGHHCTQPLHQYLDVPASARASLYIYNTRHEVDMFIDALGDSIKFFTDLNF